MLGERQRISYYNPFSYQNMLRLHEPEIRVFEPVEDLATNPEDEDSSQSTGS